MKKAVIACLSRTHYHPQQYNIIINHNMAIQKIYDSNIFDIIIFHEDSMTQEHQRYIQHFTPGLPIQFVNVMKDFDPSFARSKGRWSTYFDHPGFPMGYRHMCRFWFHAFLKYTKNYKYTIRIDDDCMIQSGLTDVINDMENSNVKYVSGYIDYNFTEPYPVVSGLQECADEFGKLHGMNEPLSMKTAPYTNFFIVDNDFFNTSITFKEWAEFVDDEGGIYVSRWGDMPLIGIFMKNFMTPDQYKADNRIRYFHGSHNSQVENGTLRENALL